MYRAVHFKKAVWIKICSSVVGVSLCAFWESGPVVCICLTVSLTSWDMPHAQYSASICIGPERTHQVAVGWKQRQSIFFLYL